MTSGQEWISVAEYARYFGISVRTATRWATTDPAMRVRRLGPNGRTIRIHITELHSERKIPAAS